MFNWKQGIKEKIIRFFLLISRFIAGIVFVFSGFVKAVDPLGSTYKFIDYFNAFNLEFLTSLAFPLAILLSTVELLIGIALILGFRMKMTSWVLFIFMSFFTILTLILALTNPVSDCGCFGDAIILTNWQTFWKNVIIMVFVIIVFTGRKKYNVLYKPSTEWSVLSVIFIIFILFSVYCFRHLPILDFRPYNIGTYIPGKMVIPEGMPVDEYETILVYEKDGVVKEFSLEDEEWQDGTWTWVETKQKLIKKGYEPPIHDFTITSSEGIDITDMVLDDINYSFLLVTYKIDTTNLQAYQRANDIALFCEQHPEFSFYCLTASTMPETDRLKELTDIGFDFFLTDEITLKTIVRSNPGLVLIKEGTIIGKWHHHDFPETNFLDDTVMAKQFNKKRKNIETMYAIIFILLFGLGITIFKLIKNN